MDGVGNERHNARCPERLLKVLVCFWTQGLVVVDKYIFVNYYLANWYNPWSEDYYEGCLRVTICLLLTSSHVLALM